MLWTASRPGIFAAQVEFPEQWPGFFTQLVALLGGGEGPVDMFCRVLVAIDEDVVSLDIPRSPEGVRASMALKARRSQVQLCLAIDPR